MSEEALQSPAIDPMRDGEHAAFVETSVRNEHMQVGIEPQKIPKGLSYAVDAYFSKAKIINLNEQAGFPFKIIDVIS